MYLILVAVHIYANYSAVRALCLNTLNEDRLALIIKNYMVHERISEPQNINKEESIFSFGNISKRNIFYNLYIFIVYKKIVTSFEYYYFS